MKKGGYIGVCTIQMDYFIEVILKHGMVVAWFGLVHVGFSLIPLILLIKLIDSW